MGSGKYGLDTVKDVCGVGNHIGWTVMVIYDVWDSPESTHREQKKLLNVNLEKFIEKYGDWLYQGWYTTGMKEADMWVSAKRPYCFKGNEVKL